MIGGAVANADWKCTVSTTHSSMPMGSFLRMSERRILEGIMAALDLTHWFILFPALCALPAQKRTLAKVLDRPYVSANRVHKAVHVFASMIRKVAGSGRQRQTRHKSRLRSSVLQIIQKVISWRCFFCLLLTLMSPFPRLLPALDISSCCCPCYWERRKTQTPAWLVSIV